MPMTDLTWSLRKCVSRTASHSVFCFAAGEGLDDVGSISRSGRFVRGNQLQLKVEAATLVHVDWLAALPRSGGDP